MHPFHSLDLCTINGQTVLYYYGSKQIGPGLKRYGESKEADIIVSVSFVSLFADDDGTEEEMKRRRKRGKEEGGGKEENLEREKGV